MSYRYDVTTVQKRPWQQIVVRGYSRILVVRVFCQ